MRRLQPGERLLKLRARALLDDVAVGDDERLERQREEALDAGAGVRSLMKTRSTRLKGEAAVVRTPMNSIRCAQKPRGRWTLKTRSVRMRVRVAWWKNANSRAPVPPR